MALTYYWAANTTGTRPALGAMSTTALLSDGSVGDTTTWPTNSQVISTSPGVGGTAYGFALVDLGGLVTLTALSLTYGAIQTFDPGNVPPKSFSIVVSYSPDSTVGADGTWVTIATYNPTVTTDGQSNPTTSTPSFASVSARMVRVDYTYNGIASVATVSATIKASDLRPTIIDPSAPCTPPAAPTLACNWLTSPLRGRLTGV